MPVYILLIAAIVLLLVSIIFIKRDRKKKIRYRTQASGFVIVCISVILFISFCRIYKNFTIERADVKKTIITDICDTDTVTLSSTAACSDTVINMADFINAYKDNRGSSYITYTDQFLNKRKVPLEHIVNAYEDKDLDGGKVKISRVLCKEYDGRFSKWSIDYEVFFGCQDNTALK